ncbi:MAG: ATP-binding protein [Bacteroidota bacterium]
MSINTLIPPSIQAEPSVYRSFRLIVIIDLVLAISATFFAPIFWWMDYHPGTYILIYTVINALIFLGLMYYTQNHTLSGNFFSAQSWVVFTALICTSGGSTSPCYLWLLSIPPIAVYYLSWRSARVWLLLTLVSAIGIPVVELLGYTFTNYLREVYRPYLALFNYLALLALLMVVFQSFKGIYRRVNAKLLRTNGQLKRSNRDLERFAFVASHDLKSPLRNVISFVRLFIRRHGHDLDPEPLEYLTIAENSALQMEQLIEDILEYSQTSNPVLREEAVDLNDQMRRVCEQLLHDPTYTNVSIEFDSLPVVKADAVRIYQIFQNLVENGLKYNRSATPRVRVHYTATEREHQFVVEDNGIGIPPEFQERIFKMFERLHNQANFQGTGIGLAICLKNVQAYGGRIEVHSEVDEGSRFCLFFPKSKLETLAPPAELPAPPIRAEQSPQSPVHPTASL